MAAIHASYVDELYMLKQYTWNRELLADVDLAEAPMPTGCTWQTKLQLWTA